MIDNKSSENLIKQYLKEQDYNSWSYWHSKMWDDVIKKFNRSQS